MNKDFTRYGIVKNIEKSPYTVTLMGVTYYFTSKLYYLKFLKNFPAYRVKISESLSKRFNFDIDQKILADLSLYLKIEKRDFLIENKEGEKICLKNLLLSGANPINNCCREKSITSIKN